MPSLEALLVNNSSHLPIFEEKRFSSNLCDSIKHDVMLAELWSDRSKGWAWSWSWPWSDIRGHLCDVSRDIVTLQSEQELPWFLKGSLCAMSS